MKLLQRLGIDAARMNENDSVFLYQLLLPIFSGVKSVIRKDMQKYYYSEVEKWSNIYEDQLGIGRS